MIIFNKFCVNWFRYLKQSHINSVLFGCREVSLWILSTFMPIVALHAGYVACVFGHWGPFHPENFLSKVSFESLKSRDRPCVHFAQNRTRSRPYFVKFIFERRLWYASTRKVHAWAVTWLGFLKGLSKETFNCEMGRIICLWPSWSLLANITGQ